tara:strand:- start:1870 stop:2661 length:792 start_codon:yes stop_codon:yes gene_type:complete
VWFSVLGSVFANVTLVYSVVVNCCKAFGQAVLAPLVWRFLVRFEILLNGEVVCVSGVFGHGVLSNIVTYVERQEEHPECTLSVGGLGTYEGEHRHVGWAERELHEGDEVTIRVLPAGEFEQPKEMKASAFSSQLEDPVFGNIHYHMGYWLGEVYLAWGPFDLLRFRVFADEAGPSNEQRILFQDTMKGFHVMWPNIVEKMWYCHPVFSSVDELSKQLHSQCHAEFLQHPGHLRLLLSVSGEDTLRGYAVELQDGEVTHVEVRT